MTSARALSRFLEGASRIVAFTGAGISTESGIPDFRSPGGVWSRMKPIYFQEFLHDEAKRREAWQRAFSGTAGWTGGAPNRGHMALSRMFDAGRLLGVITQNVDNLHQESGIPAERVIELHGNASYASCLGCSKRYTLQSFSRPFLEEGIIPVCGDCGELVKVATISFGQPMPAEPMRRARDASLAADVFLVLGSSLVVQPAAGFPPLAKQHGARLAIVNREPTPLDRIADLVIHDELGPTLGDLPLDPAGGDIT